MSYIKTLDEYEDYELKNELDRRILVRTQGLCDYCGREQITSVCKFTHRHKSNLIEYIKTECEKLLTEPLPMTTELPIECGEFNRYTIPMVRLINSRHPFMIPSIE